MTVDIRPGMACFFGAVLEVSLYTAADAAGALTCAREKSAASGGSCGKTFGQVGLIDKEANQRCIITLIKRDAGRP